VKSRGNSSFLIGLYDSFQAAFEGKNTQLNIKLDFRLKRRLVDVRIAEIYTSST